MDQQKIGKFIAQRRKAAGLTQLQLAQALEITDRAVSKWENGRAMPDAATMLPLCALLGITVTDLLCGEVVTMDNYNKELENKLVETIKAKEESDRRLLTLEWVIGILSCIILFVPIFVAALAPLEAWVRILLIFSGFIPAMIGLHFALKIEQTAGYYQCKLCQHKYVPTLGSVYKAPHMGRTRRMRCPQCGQKSWHKKVLTKE